METIREYVEKWRRDLQEATSSITGSSSKDYHQMILDLDRPTPKDQTTIFRIRSAFAFSTMVGSLLSTATVWWLTKNGGSSWYRLRYPLMAAAAWGGAIVGARQGTQMGKAMIPALEDTKLREIMLAYQNGQLSAKEELSLKRNVLDSVRPEDIREYELHKNDISVREQLDHLKNERERLRSPPPSPASNTNPPPELTPANPPTRAHGPTPYLRQRLPEAIEAERRRAEAQQPPAAAQKPSETNP